MFRTTIRDTPFTTETADEVFPNITGDSVYGDVSFLATLRALLGPRLKPEESVKFQFSSSDYADDNIRRVPARNALNAIVRSMDLDGEDAAGLFYLHSFSGDDEGNRASLEVVEREFPEKYPGWRRLEKVTVFFQKSFPVLCYVNPERRGAVLFADSLDLRRLHYIQLAVIPALTWYFADADAIRGDADIQDLIQSLRETSPDRYLACLERMARRYDFRSTRIRRALRGFESRHERRERDLVAAQIQSHDERIEQLNGSIADLLQQRNDLCLSLLGLEQRIAAGSEDSELMEYFLCNDRLYLETVDGADMVFCVRDNLTYFDTDMVERCLDNELSFVYYNGAGRRYTSIAPGRMAKLMRAVFLDGTLKIRVCAAYRFNLNGRVEGLARYSFPECEFSGYLPNPHIQQFHCMGNYSREINGMLKERNYIGALEQCVASCKSLNWGDSTVMHTFMDWMYGVGLDGRSNRCVRLPDGSVVKPEQAIAWLEEQEAAANGKAKEEEDAHE